MQRHRNGLRLARSLLKEPALARLAAQVLESDSLSGTDSELNDFILKRIQTAHHPCGTARMGSATDPMSVVDRNCNVIGVEGLYVADASIIPVPVRANTNLTCIMIGERMAAMLAAGAIKVIRGQPLY